MDRSFSQGYVKGREMGPPHLTRKDPAMVALAVWDGVKEDRNGRKVISVWQRLNILDK